jgi:hypothetical protein
MDLGKFVGIQGLDAWKHAFTPDQNLPQYQGKNGLTDSFFQDTVSNARKWWLDNSNQYSAAP